MSEENNQEQEPQTMKVDFGSVSLDLPAEQAKALIAERDKRQAEYRETMDRLNAIETREQEAARKAEEARLEKEAAEARAKGDVEKAEKLIQQKYETELSSLRSQMKDDKLDAALASCGQLAEGTRPVVRKFLSDQVSIVDGKLVKVGEDGKPATNPDGSPITADAVLSSFLEEYPAFAVSKAPPPDGSNSKAHQGGAAVLKQAEFDAMPQKQRLAWFKANPGARVVA